MAPGPQKKVILSIGACGLDRLLTLERHPVPDEKVKTTAYNEVGGGNAANTATAIALLSQASIFGGQFTVKLLAKVGDNIIGENKL